MVHVTGEGGKRARVALPPLARLRHGSIATTPMYLYGDDILRTGEINQAFGGR